MNEHELEAMVVTINADLQSFKHEMEEAKEVTAHAAHAMEEHGNRLDRLAHKAEGLGESVVKALEALGIEHFLHEALGEWQEAESGILKLTATLEANGREVEKTREDYEQFASAMQELTVNSDDSVLAVLRMAETFGLTGDKAKSATQNAIALAAVTGGNASGMIRFTAALEKGDTATAMRMARMIPQLRGIKNESQFVAKATQLIQSGWATARAEANSSAGSLKQLKNAYGDLLEDIGKVVAEGIKPFVQYVREGIALLKGVSPETKQIAVYALAVGAALLMVGPLIAGLGIALGPVISLVSTLWPLLGLLVNPITLAVAAVVLLSSLFVDWKSVAGEAIAWVTKQWDSLVEYFKPAFDGVMAALRAGNLELAFKIVVLQLKVIWAEFNAWFVEYWNATKDVFVDGWHDANTQGTLGAIDVITYLKSDWTEYFDWFLTKMADISDALGQTDFARGLRVLRDADAGEVERAGKLAKESVKRQAKEAEDARKAARAKDLEDAKAAAAAAQDELKQSIDDAEWAEFWKSFEDESIDIKPHVKVDPKDKPEIDAKIVPKFDAADYRSAEAFARVRDFQENLRLQIEGNPTGQSKKEKDANTPILEDIRDELKDQDTIGVSKLG